MTSPRTVRIHYLRPPANLTVYRQLLVHDDNRVKVTLARRMELEEPLRFAGRTALEDGSSAVWFTFPGAWHDIGRFYLADGTPSGIYANVITPCRFHPGGVWSTTDLFLDLWIPAEEGSYAWGAIRLLDRAELNRAEAAGHVAPPLAERARREAARLQAELTASNWPPPPVMDWTLERAVEVARAGARGDTRAGS